MKRMMLWFATFGFVGLLACPSAYAAKDGHEGTDGPNEPRTLINFDGALLIGGDATSLGVNVGISIRLVNDTPLYVGAEVGGFVGTVSPSYVIVPILADLHYQLVPQAWVHPLFGVMAGTAISSGGGYSTANFEFMVRPGVNLSFFQSVSLNLEPRFGIIGSNFIFAPQVGVVFAM